MNRTTYIAFIAVLLLVILAIGYNALNTSEQPSDLLPYAQQFCDDEVTATVETSQNTGYIKVTSTLLGGGSTYYTASNEEGVQCPVVGPDSISEECKTLMNISDWEILCSKTQVLPSAEEAELTAFGFMLDFIDSAPPEVQEEALQDMLAVLSSRAQSEINTTNLSSEFARFVKVQDVPDQGVSLEDVQLHDEGTATVTVGLNYSGGRTLRNVHLIVENGVWKINDISIKEETHGTFEHSGVLTKDAPGQKPDTWFLLYEAPGRPALTQELRFDTSSICAIGVENSSCDTDTLTAGTPVAVFGEFQEDGVVLVTRLEIRE